MKYSVSFYFMIQFPQITKRDYKLHKTWNEFISSLSEMVGWQNYCKHFAYFIFWNYRTENSKQHKILAESFVAWIISWIHIFSLFSFRGENYLPKLATNLRVYSHKKSLHSKWSKCIDFYGFAVCSTLAFVGAFLIRIYRVLIKSCVCHS